MKPTLLLVTGWAHGAESLRPLADALAPAFETRVLSGAEVLGEGRLPAAEFVVAHSMGGMLALQYLPPECGKLVLLSSTARFCAADGYPCGIPEKVLRRMILQLRRNPDAVLREFFRNVHHPEIRAGGTRPAEPLEPLIAGLEYLRDADLRARVPAIGIPVLILHGTEDRIIPPSAAEWLRDHLPDARLRLLEGVGHALPIHQADAAARAIFQFLEA